MFFLTTLTHILMSHAKVDEASARSCAKVTYIGRSRKKRGWRQILTLAPATSPHNKSLFSAAAAWTDPRCLRYQNHDSTRRYGKSQGADRGLRTDHVTPNASGWLERVRRDTRWRPGDL